MNYSDNVLKVLGVNNFTKYRAKNFAPKSMYNHDHRSLIPWSCGKFERGVGCTSEIKESILNIAGKGMRKGPSLHIIDALFIAGEDIRNKELKLRNSLLKTFGNFESVQITEKYIIIWQILRRISIWHQLN